MQYPLAKKNKVIIQTIFHSLLRHSEKTIISLTRIENQDGDFSLKNSRHFYPTLFSFRSLKVKYPDYGITSYIVLIPARCRWFGVQLAISPYYGKPETHAKLLRTHQKEEKVERTEEKTDEILLIKFLLKFTCVVCEEFANLRGQSYAYIPTSIYCT